MIIRYCVLQGIIALSILLFTVSGYTQGTTRTSGSNLFVADSDISANDEIRVVLIEDSILYIGGRFSRVTDASGSYRRNGLAAINLKERRVTRFRADIDRGTVRAVTLYRGVVYAAGTFTKVNNQHRSKIVALDPVTGDVLSTFGDDTDSIDGPVYSLACLDDKLFAGGNFTHVNSKPRSYLAAFNAENGVLDSAFNPSPADSMDFDGKMGGGVYALEVCEADSSRPAMLFAGGNFQTINGANGRPFLVALTADGTPGPDFSGRISSPVLDIDYRNSVLYAGFGGFGNRSGAFDVGSDLITERWKGVTAQGDVQAVACSENGFLFFSFHQGLFDTTDYYRCAIHSADNGSLYDILPEMNSFFGVWSIDAEQEYVVVGGAFTKVNGSRQNHLAVFPMPEYPVNSLPEQVVLCDVSDSSSVNPVNLLLRWKWVAYTGAYELQVATDNWFVNCTVTNGQLQGLSKRCSGLEYCTRYYWRVRATNALGAGPWSEVDSFVTIPSDDEIPVITTPVHNSVTSQSSTVATWIYEQKAYSYTVQLAFDADFSALVFAADKMADTAILCTNLLYNSNYVLRVRAETVGGPTEWAQVEFSTAPQILETPVVHYPLNNAINVATTPVLTWAKIDNEATYRIQLSEDSAFSRPLFSPVNETDSMVRAPELQTNTHYFWRIAADNRWGSSEWSGTCSFFTLPYSGEAPVLQYPQDGSLYLPLAFECLVQQSNSVLSYNCQLSNDHNFTTLFSDSGYPAGAPILIHGLLHDSSYYLRIRGINNSGYTEWASCRFRTVPYPLGVPHPKMPADNELQVSCIPTFVWEKGEHAQMYRFQLATDSGFARVLLDTIGCSDTTLISPELSNDTRYFWRVNASNAGGDIWSVPMQFTTEYSLPDNPVAQFPLSGSTVSTDSVTIVWYAGNPHVSAYLIELSYDSAMTPLIEDAVITDTMYRLKGLVNASKVFWRVKAFNARGGGGFSATEVFTTAFPAEYQFALSRFHFKRGVGSVCYTIAQRCDLDLALLSVKGEEVWHVRSSSVKSGQYTTSMDTKNLVAGYYVLTINAGSFSSRLGAVLVK